MRKDFKMTAEQFIKNLSVPSGTVDVVLDTDAYNEIDDQFAIAYLLRSKEKLCTRAIYAAPFLNEKSESPCDGMEKSHAEILKLLSLMGEECTVFKGSREFLRDEHTPCDSPAVRDLVLRAESYSSERPLYVVAIGAITNIASALLTAPSIAEKIVVVWLGGNARHYTDTKEFNMLSDYAAARVVMQRGVPLVQLPCLGVVTEFRISGPELDFWLADKNPLCSYLAKNTKDAVKALQGTPWTRVIWDVTAVAWLKNDSDRFMLSRLIPIRLPEYSGVYSEKDEDTLQRYVYSINRDALMQDLIDKITQA